MLITTLLSSKLVCWSFLDSSCRVKYLSARLDIITTRSSTRVGFRLLGNIRLGCPWSAVPNATTYLTLPKDSTKMLVTSKHSQLSLMFEGETERIILSITGSIFR